MRSSDARRDLWRRTAARVGTRPFVAAITVVTIVVTAVALYLRPVDDLGFYYDDWGALAAYDDAAGDSWSQKLALCRRVLDPAGRIGSCLYSTTVNGLLGERVRVYHALSIVLLIACALLLYVLLRGCRLGHWPSLLAALMFIVYPGSDSTRLWAGAMFGQYVLAVYITAVLLAIAGQRRTGAQALALHVASFGLLVLLLLTYEVVVPLVALSGVLYLLASPAARRPALLRGAVDLGLALAFTAYRLTIAPVDAEAGFVESRTIGQQIERVEAVLRGAWESFAPLFFPGTAAAVVVAIGAVVWIVAAATDRAVRRNSLRWLVAAVVGFTFAVAAVLAYVVANDYYVPDPNSLFNRLNLAAAPAYCVMFVALCGLLWTALARWLPRAAATAVVALLVIGVAADQVARERRSQDAWAASWDDQRAAILKLQALAPRLERDASVMSFGHPIWERNFIPVFSATWDLRGAIDLRTPVDPPVAMPFDTTAACGPRDVLVNSSPFVAYRGDSPLWFAHLTTGEVRRITSRAACEKAVAEWGRPPFWGKTIG